MILTLSAQTRAVCDSIQSAFLIESMMCASPRLAAKMIRWDLGLVQFFTFALSFDARAEAVSQVDQMLTSVMQLYCMHDALFFAPFASLVSFLAKEMQLRNFEVDVEETIQWKLLFHKERASSEER